MVKIGERFQFYVISKIEDKDNVTAIHDQWCYGETCLKYAKKLINVLRDTDWENMQMEYINEYIKSILSVRWHSGNHKYFHHRIHIESMGYTPRDADTNHGCVIIDIRNLKNIKTGFYTTDGKFVTAEDFVGRENEDRSDGYKMKPDEFKEVMKTYYDKSFDKLTQKDYENLCNYMDKLAKEQVVERLEG